MKTFLPPLNAQEEKECLKQMKEGNPTAKNELIEHNMRLVAHIARKYQNVDEEPEDMISIGTIGLIKAIVSYRDDKGCKLATYAARCIDNELLMHLRAKRKTSKEVSLYEPIGTDKEGNQISLFDVVENDEPDVVEQLQYDRNVEQMYEYYRRHLDPREQQVLRLRYGLHGQIPVTQREIARLLGISRSYVSRIEKKAILKLRRSFLENEI